MVETPEKWLKNTREAATGAYQTRARHVALLDSSNAWASALTEAFQREPPAERTASMEMTAVILKGSFRVGRPGIETARQ